MGRNEVSPQNRTRHGWWIATCLERFENYDEDRRNLLDAGADVHGRGDLHKGDGSCWAAREGNEAVISLLLERGSRHHIFSAMALGDWTLSRDWSKNQDLTWSRCRVRVVGSCGVRHELG